MKTALLIIALALAGIARSTPSQAGAGYIITESGAPSKWSVASNVSIHPESGACGSFTNAQMLTKIETNLGYWTDLSEVSFNFTITSGSVSGVDGCNYGDYLVGVTGASNTGLNDGFNPIVFDNDGEIIAAVAGTSNKYRVLGFANPSGFSSDYAQILDGQAVFNCLCLSGNSFGPCTIGQQTVTFSEDELNFTMTHEIGHFMNLDHTQINSDIVNNGNATDDDYIPAMYPVSENAAEQISPIQDDISSLGVLYPSSTFASAHCLITGSLLDSTGNQLRCADVQAIPSDRSKSVAFVSGAYAPAVDRNGDGDTVDTVSGTQECRSGCGDFQLYLDPGVTYTVKVMPINSSFTGGSGISPCANGQLTTIQEETIATVEASACTAGTTVALGSITTTSTGGITPSGSVSVLPALYDDEIPAEEYADMATGLDGHADDYYFQEELLEDDMPPLLIGGGANPLEQESCPESGGSSTTTTGSSGTSSNSTGSSSSSGCNLRQSPSPRTVPYTAILACVTLLALGMSRFFSRRQPTA